MTAKLIPIPKKPGNLPAIGERVFSRRGRPMRVIGHSCYSYRMDDGTIRYQPWTVDVEALDGQDYTGPFSWWPSDCIRAGDTLPLF